MEFQRTIKEVALLAPPDFDLDVQEIEYREDPLTNSRCVLNVRRAERVQQAQTTALVSDAVIEETRKGCFFCPEQIEKKTPRFAESISREGKVKRGESVVFPNLFPFAEYHAVATLTSKHFLDLDQFDPEMLTDNILACTEWTLCVNRNNKKAKFPVYMWNYMPPSGASVVHPHVQVLVHEVPTYVQRDLLQKSEEYLRNNGQSYWVALINEEKNLGMRYIGENDSLAVIASYAPRGFREVQFIFKDISSLADLGEKQAKDFAQSAVKILHGYKQMGVGSFNLNIFSGPIGEKLNYYALNAKIISRPFPQTVYTNDTGSLERLQDEWVIETLPEDVAERMRGVFVA